MATGAPIPNPVVTDRRCDNLVAIPIGLGRTGGSGAGGVRTRLSLGSGFAFAGVW